MTTHLRGEVDQIRIRREALGLTQHEAARKANLSLATWRRLESGGSDVTPRNSTVEAIERVLKLPKGGFADLRTGDGVDHLPMPRAMREWLSSFGENFDRDPFTPRQAYKLVMVTIGLEDDDLWRDYLKGECTITEIPVLRGLPDWVLFTVSAHWLRKFRSVILRIADEIEGGSVPYPECIADHVALRLLVREAKKRSSDFDELIEVEDPDGSILPTDPDLEQYWGFVDAALFNDHFALERIWDADFTKLTFGNPSALLDPDEGVTVGEVHPFRWWEPRPEGTSA